MWLCGEYRLVVRAAPPSPTSCKQGLNTEKAEDQEGHMTEAASLGRHGRRRPAIPDANGGIKLRHDDGAHAVPNSI